MAADEGAAVAQDWKADVIDFNCRLEIMISTLGNKYLDATFFLFDMNGLFSSVLDNTADSGLTAAYVDTTHNCSVYADSYLGTPLPSMTSKSPD
ncbi:hypothetical protein ABVK25_009495 [Lepraria finkii]|uniref:Uncharacterized protein n=1 Tax=Lepraria finkii TaxID=1340010 RepID=A0ABR4AYP5_9LECA